MDGRNLEGKVVLVTGGSRGIGREIVRQAIAEDARVAFCACEIGAEANDILGAIQGNSGRQRAIAVQTNVAREADVEAFFEAAERALGKVDVVINNAGITRAKLLVSLPAETWDDVLSTNLTGSFLVAKYAIRQFRKQGTGGRIINVGSVTQNGAPSDVAYATSKGGLSGLTSWIAAEYGEQGIIALAIAGGYADTELLHNLPPGLRQWIVDSTPLKRLVAARELAAAILFMASDAGLYLKNGQTLWVSGGMLDPTAEP